MRVVSIVGARPQFVKLAPMAKAFAAAGVEHLIIHTGQHYDAAMSDAFFRGFGIPDPYAHLGVGSGTHGSQTGSILAQLDPVLAEIEPDWVLAYGDTNSTIAGALSAVKMHIPLAHLEAGLRSHNRAMPEEHNRVLTDHAADLCLAPTEAAMISLEKEGLLGRSVLVGDVMVDVCLQTRDIVTANPVDAPWDGNDDFILATIHRAENTDDPKRLADILSTLARLDLPVVVPAHPRLIARAKEYGLSLEQGSLRAVNPLTYPQMVQLILKSRSVVTDSGGVQKEAFLLERPCTTLRQETEWVETLEGGWNILDPALSLVESSALRAAPQGTQLIPYGEGRAAHTVVSELLGRS